MATRRPNDLEREVFRTSQDLASTAATITWKVCKIPTGRKLLVTRIYYINPTGLATDGSNYFTLVAKNGSTTVATIANTNSSGGAAITADTFVEGTLSATAANLWLTAADILSLVATKTGTQTLPAGRVLIEGYLY